MESNDPTAPTRDGQPARFSFVAEVCELGFQTGLTEASYSFRGQPQVLEFCRERALSRSEMNT